MADRRTDGQSFPLKYPYKILLQYMENSKARKQLESLIHVTYGKYLEIP